VTGLCRSDTGGNQQLKKLQPDIIGPVRHLRRAVSHRNHHLIVLELVRVTRLKYSKILFEKIDE
jgi:hypothetical protein